MKLTESGTELDSLAQLQELVTRNIKQKEHIKKMEEYLVLKKAEEREVSEKLIPRLLESLGMSELKTVGGQKVTVKKVYHAKISNNNASEAFAWLKANGHSAIVRDKIGVDLGLGDESAAEQVMESLDAMGLPISRSCSVHPQTLKAFVKEQIESGNEFPKDLFGVYEHYTTEIK